MGIDIFSPNVSHDLMFQTSTQSDKDIKLSIRQGRVPKWDINCGKGKCTIMFLKDNEPFIW